MKQEIQLKVNGELFTVEIEHHRTLLEVIRENLGLTGTKEMCNKGDCGGCTVLIDDKPALSCLMLAIEAHGKEILTIEGLSEGYALHPIQKAFIEYGAIQCGFCIPGMILAAKALLEENPHPSREDIKMGISGNLCRCTGYQNIVKAVSSVWGLEVPQ